MNWRLLAAAAALSMAAGCGLAYCQHQSDEAPAPAPVDCVSVVEAVPLGTGHPGFRKAAPDSRREARREPRTDRRTPELRKPSRAL